MSTNFGIYAQIPARLTQPARPGDWITLWGTGLGKYSHPSVLIGGHPGTIAYIGPAPGDAGLDQINVQIPSDPVIPNGCSVAFQFQADGTGSNVVSLPKSDRSGPCQSEIGLSSDELLTLDQGRSIPLGDLWIWSRVGPDLTGTQGSTSASALLTKNVNRQETAEVLFTSLDAKEILQLIAPRLANNAYSGCTANQGNGLVGAWLSVGSLDAGDKLTLIGPSATFDLPAPDSTFHGLYELSVPPTPYFPDPASLPPAVFGPGNWVFSGLGSRDMPAFQQPFTLPKQMLISNLATVTMLDHTKNQTITWEGTSYSDHETMLVTLQGSSSVPASQWFDTSSNYSVSCRVPATIGQVIIPANLLTPFTPSLTGNMLSIGIQQNPAQLQSFRLHLTNGSSVPVLLNYQFTESVPVAIQ